MGNQPCQGTLSQKRGYLLNTLPLNKFCKNYAVRILHDVIPECWKKRETRHSAVGKLPYSHKRKVCSIAGNFRRTTTLDVTDEPQTGWGILPHQEFFPLFV